MRQLISNHSKDMKSGVIVKPKKRKPLPTFPVLYVSEEQQARVLREMLEGLSYPPLPSGLVFTFPLDLFD